MRKKYNRFLSFPVLLLLILISVQESKAQDDRVFNAGLQLGISGSQVHGDGLSGFNKFGILGGFFVNTQISDDFLISMELNFLQKGSRKTTNAENNDYISYRMSLNYAQVPIILTYKLNEKLSFHAGPAIGFLLSNKEEDFSGEIGNNPPFKKYEIAGVAGVQYKISDKLAGQIRIDQSLLPIREKKNNTVTQLEGRQYNSSLIFSLLYLL